MSKSVLIVDDSESQVSRIRRYLVDFHCVVDDANSYNKASELIKENDYDLFIIDIVLKGKRPGTDLIGHGAHPDKTIIISGHGDTLDESNILELNKLYNIPSERILHKPLSNKIFMEVVSEILHENPGADDGFIKECIEEKEDSNYIPESKDIVSVEINFRKIFKYLKKLSLKQWIQIGVSVFAFNSFLIGLSIQYGYEKHEQFNKDLETYCNKKFYEFTPGKNITNSTYVEHEYTFHGGRTVIKIYPKSFVKIIVFYDDKPPIVHWIYGPDYIEEIGINKSVTERISEFIKRLL